MIRDDRAASTGTNGTAPVPPGSGLDAPALVSAPVAMYALDLLGNLCLWNPAAEALFGWTADEPTSHPLDDFAVERK